jgi:Zn-dependent protease with chaperone function
MKVSEIQKAFGHRLIGTRLMKRMVVTALRRMPDKTIEKVTKHCWFVSSFEDGWAFTLRHNDLKRGEFLIFLSDELLQEDENQIIWTITHEIGHVILGHRNSIGVVQSKAEIRKQEKEADEFAIKILRDRGEI